MRLVGSGAASPRAVKRAAFLAFGVAAVAGLVLAATTAWWLVAVGVVCVLAAWFYTGGVAPLRLPRAGRGDGVRASSGWSRWSARRTSRPRTLARWPALYAAVGIGALACAMLVVNNLRDMPTDTVAGKRTLAVVLGDARTRALYLLLVLAAAAAVVAVAVATTWCGAGRAGLPGAWRCAASGPCWAAPPGPALVPVLQQTGLAELVWAVLVAVPLLLAG